MTSMIESPTNIVAVEASTSGEQRRGWHFWVSKYHQNLLLKYCYELALTFGRPL